MKQAATATPPLTMKKKAPRKKKAKPVKFIDLPSPMDVLCGQDRNYTKHPGNIMFRRVIHAVMDRYQAAATKQDKMQCTRTVVHILKMRCGSRFLKKTRALDGKKAWQELEDQPARDKVSHAIRFACANRHTENRSMVWHTAANQAISKSCFPRQYQATQDNLQGTEVTTLLQQFSATLTCVATTHIDTRGASDSESTAQDRAFPTGARGAIPPVGKISTQERSACPVSPSMNESVGKAWRKDSNGSDIDNARLPRPGEGIEVPATALLQMQWKDAEYRSLPENKIAVCDPLPVDAQGSNNMDAESSGNFSEQPLHVHEEIAYDQELIDFLQGTWGVQGCLSHEDCVELPSFVTNVPTEERDSDFVDVQNGIASNDGFESLDVGKSTASWADVMDLLVS